MWVLGIKFRLADLVTACFTFWANAHPQVLGFLRYGLTVPKASLVLRTVPLSQPPKCHDHRRIHMAHFNLLLFLLSVQGLYIQTKPKIAAQVGQ